MESAFQEDGVLSRKEFKEGLSRSDIGRREASPETAWSEESLRRDFRAFAEGVLHFDYDWAAIRKAPGTSKNLRHAMRAILFVRPNSSHRCVSLR